LVQHCCTAIVQEDTLVGVTFKAVCARLAGVGLRSSPVLTHSSVCAHSVGA
jgi:hypothetical protein